MVLCLPPAKIIKIAKEAFEEQTGKKVIQIKSPYHLSF